MVLRSEPGEYIELGQLGMSLKKNLAKNGKQNSGCGTGQPAFGPF